MILLILIDLSFIHIYRNLRKETYFYFLLVLHLKTFLIEFEEKNIFLSLPVVYFDVLVSLRVVHEPHQLQVKDRGESEEFDSFFCFLWHKEINHPVKSITLNDSI